jgi:hypothetical protein
MKQAKNRLRFSPFFLPFHLTPFSFCAILLLKNERPKTAVIQGVQIMLKGDQTLCDCGHYATCDGLGTGYGIDAKGVKTCYTCIGLADRKELIETGKQTGYLSMKHRIYDGLGTIRYGRGHDAMEDGTYGNWPGTFTIPIRGVNAKRSVNNFGAERIDFWFTFEGRKYWGVNIGDNQVARVRRIK